MGDPAPTLKRIDIVVNPAAGQDVPVLGTFNTIFGAAGVDWNLLITKQSGDAVRLAQAAAAAGADIVAAYGGDGTVMEVASGLRGTGVPLAILPGGTANVMALDLGIPADLAGACALLISQNWTVRPVDMIQAGEHTCLVRVSCGLEAAMIEGADQEMKGRLGWLAYALSGLQALREPQVARYRLTLDGQSLETEGLTCIVANTGLIGKTTFSMAPNITVSDGLLDVIVIRSADLASVVALAASVVAGAQEPEPLLHWQACEIVIASDPAQTVQGDGEMIGQTPIEVKVLPQAVDVIVPKVV
jgi:YegS/Rv2252/BmrU family lipid kinase